MWSVNVPLLQTWHSRMSPLLYVKSYQASPADQFTTISNSYSLEMECITDMKCVLSLNRCLLTPAFIAHNGRTGKTHHVKGHTWMSGGHLEKRHIHEKQKQLYSLAYRRATGWLLNPSNITKNTFFFNRSVTVESWHVVCKCATPPAHHWLSLHVKSFTRLPLLINSLQTQTVTHEVKAIEPLVKPSCRQATLASVELNESSHTVPHCPLR